MLTVIPKTEICLKAFDRFPAIYKEEQNNASYQVQECK